MNNLLLGKITGFLESLACLHSLLDYYIHFDYSFYKLEMDGTEKTTIRKEIIRKYREFAENNPTWNCDVQHFISIMDTDFDLVKLDNWKEVFGQKLPAWFLGKYINDLKMKYRISSPYWVIQTFIGLLYDFFKDTNFKVWEFNEKIKEKLFYFWGGVGFQDFVFSYPHGLYLMHLEFSD